MCAFDARNIVTVSVSECCECNKKKKNETVHIDCVLMCNGWRCNKNKMIYNVDSLNSVSLISVRIEQ